MFQKPGYTPVAREPSSRSDPLPLPKSVFDRALEIVLKLEGGLSRDPRDPGNSGGTATNRGITQRTYNQWLDSKHRAHADVADVTEGEVRQIYLERYWQKGKCDKLEGAVAIAHMDACVNLGVRRASKLLQSALREAGFSEVEVDGVIGPVTIRAAQKADQARLFEAMLEKREERYRMLGRREKYAPFLEGWLNRLSILRKELEY